MSNVVLDGNVTDQNEVAVPGALVYVYDKPGGLAQLYDSMGQALPEGPVVAGEDGYWSAFVATDRYYTLKYYWGGRERLIEANILAGTEPPLGGNSDPNVRGDLAIYGQAAFSGFVAAGAGSVARPLQAKMGDVINAADKGYATTNTAAQNTTAMLLAIAALPNGGTININAGTFAQNPIQFTTNNLKIRGAGRDATIIQETADRAANAQGIFWCDSGSASAFIDGFEMSDLTLKNTVGTFKEHVHLLSLNGVRDVAIEHVGFVGFRSDGIFFGSGQVGGNERHNIRLSVRKCRFDGVNNLNRNGITCHDADDIVVDDCDFLSCTLLAAQVTSLGVAAMPGPIDFEPDGGVVYAIVRHALIQNCRFENCGGSAVNFLLTANDTYTTPAENLAVQNCSIINCERALTFYGYDVGTTAISAATRPYGFRYRDNHCRSLTKTDSLVISGLYGGIFEGNTFDAINYIALGYNDGLRQVRFERNTFIRGASAQQILVQRNLMDVTFNANLFARPPASIVLLRNPATGTANLTGFRFTRNRYEAAGGAAPSKVVAKDTTSGAPFDWTGSVDGDSIYGGNNFPAAATNDVPFNAVVTLANSWALDGTNPLTVNRSDDGQVTVTGKITGGTQTSGLTMFTLPVGFRPGVSVAVAVVSSFAYGTCTINANGAVVINNMPAASCEFCHTFQAAP